MAKNQVYIDVVIDDKGTTKRVAVNAKKLGIELEKSGVAADRAATGQDKIAKSARDVDRNMRGAANMTSNSTKQYSKMQQGMGGLVGAYATLAAQVFAVSAAFQFLQNASDFKNLVAGQEALGTVTGVAYKTITHAMIEATDAQLKYIDAARAAAIGTAAGLSSGQLTGLAEAAKNASFALGRDLTDSMNRLVRGVTKAEPELLDELGIILRLEPATEKYAQKIGKAREELNAYERTQAVANEVLGQAERKFGAIAELMDPSATALARFTKSFDELINIFKVGLIEGLTPILKFLTDNTMALVATLTLLGTPILKAILPNLALMRESAIKLGKVYEEQADKFEAAMDRQTAALEGQVAARKKAVAGAEADAKKALGKRDDAGTGGLGWLTGGAAGKANKGAATRILNNARKEMDQHGKILTGKLAGYNRQQLADLERAYAKKVQASKIATEKIIGHWQRAGLQIKRVGNSVMLGWNKAMVGMQTASRVAAVAMNSIFNVMAIAGIIAMIWEAGKALMNFIKPVNEALERQKEIVDELQRKYNQLGVEMGNAQKARKTLLTGTEQASSRGQSMASFDMPAFLENIDTLSNMTKGSEEFNKLQGTLMKALLAASKLDTRFVALADNIRNGEQVTKSQAERMTQLANEIINTGQIIDRLPETLQAADAAFVSLTSNFVKTTPMQEYLEIQQKAIDAQIVNLQEADRGQQALGKEIAKQIKIRQEQAKIDTEYWNNNKSLVARAVGGLNKFNKLTDAAQSKWRDLFGIEDLTKGSSYLSDEELANTKKTRIEAVDRVNDEIKALGKLRTEQQQIQKHETQRLNIQKERIRLEKAASDLASLGITKQGELNNLAQQEFNISKPYLKAQEDLNKAQTAITLNKIKGVKAGSDEDKQAQEVLRINTEQHRVAKLRYDLEMLRHNFLKAEIELQEKLLAGKIRIHELDRDTRRSEERSKDLSVFGSGRGNPIVAQAERKEKLRRLQNAVDTAKEEADAAAHTYLLEYDKIMTATEDAYRKDRGIAKDTALTREQKYDVGEIAGKELAGPGAAFDTALDDETAANNALTREQNKFQAIIGQNEEKIKQLTIDLEMVAIGDRNKILAQLIAEAKKDGLTADEMDIEALKKQADEMNNLATLAEQKQSLFDSIEGSMEGAFASIIEGSKSAKDAFADMAKSIIKHIIKMVAEMMVAKILSSSMFSWLAPAGKDGGISPGLKKGGIMPAYAGGGYSAGPKRNFSRGGTARGPNSGYNAILHGNEAVVPLPDNRHIPVEMKGGGGQQNNVTVNVTMNGDSAGNTTSSTAGDSAQASKLGDMVAKAVQEELQNQKRSGGILSPYGVA
tara:strand:- start:6629 stop:10627 length:3999 start_codon:yes stop_codon:yes gene_type:complete